VEGDVKKPMSEWAYALMCVATLLLSLSTAVAAFVAALNGNLRDATLFISSSFGTWAAFRLVLTEWGVTHGYEEKA
jgi:hypothetical protein